MSGYPTNQKLNESFQMANGLGIYFAPMVPPSEQDSGTDEVLPALNVVPVERMAGEDEEDTALLQQMLQEAKYYLNSFSWCDSVRNSYFAGGVGKIFAIFLFNISSVRRDVDKWMWIVVGDIPPAYLPWEDYHSSREVFDTYISGMKKWVQLAREGREASPEDCVPPVNVPATPEWAESLDSRLRLLQELVQPLFK